MRPINLEKMLKMEGGYIYPSLDIGCQAYAAAIVIMNGIPLGTDEAVIIYQIAYHSCLFG
ncbi:MAG TPA: hypothetical protein PLV21_12555 [Cyclobacteriaceae bacterium]|nr:hypothetical protein [Cyclobacteriaceae bacterium]HRJ82714.1 hypothetical protein [Cyclobacteriaceae bacterium]